MNFMKKVRQYKAKSEQFVNKRNSQERVLVFVVMMSAILLVWNAAILRPIRLDISNANFQVNTLQGKLKANLEKMNAYAEQLKNDPLKEQKNMKLELLKKLDEVNLTFKNMTADLVSPSKMQELLRSVLTENHGVSILSLTNGEAMRLVPEDPSIALYSHSMTLRISGEYFPVIAYLESLEKNKMRMLWGSIVYEVTTYPKAEAVLVISTISDSEGWIGV